MAKETLVVGGGPGTSDGDTIRDAYGKINSNFTETYDHIADTANPHGVTTAQIGAIPESDKAIANGVATLDANGLLTPAQKAVYTYSEITNKPVEITYNGSGELVVISDTDTTFKNDILPGTDATFNIGSLTYQFQNMFLSGTLTSNAVSAATMDATTFTGELTGNAATATVLQTSRTISLVGDVSGSVSFNGSQNVSITAVVADDSHNHVISNVDGLQAALDDKASISYVDSSISDLVESAPETLNTLNELAAALGDDPNFATTVSNQIGLKLDASAYTAADVLAKLLTVDGVGSGLDADLLDGLEQTDAATPSTIVSRDSSGNFSANIITADLSGNATTATTLETARTISLTGDVSGSASFNGSANASITVTVADDSHNHIIANVDGLQTALDNKLAIGGTAVAADVLATARTISLSGDVSGSVSFDGSGNVDIVSTVADDSHNHIIANVDGLQTALDNKLDINGTAVAADVLATARTITLVGDLTGSVSFDGSGDVSLSAQVFDNSHVHYNNTINIQTQNGVTDADAVAGNLITFSTSNTTANRPADYYTVVNIPFSTNRNFQFASYYGGLAADDKLQYRRQQDSDGAWSSWFEIWHSGYQGSGTGMDADLLDGMNSATANTASTIVARDASGNFSAGTITAALTGNASTATTLETSRTISLSGDVSGSVAFDGSGDVNITTAVADNSHTHYSDTIDIRDQSGLTDGDAAIDTFVSFSAATNTPGADYTVFNIPNTSNTNIQFAAYTGPLVGGGQFDNFLYFRRQDSSDGQWSHWNRIWNSGFQGAGSNLDADRLDGYDLAATATVDTVVRRDGVGAIYGVSFVASDSIVPVTDNTAVIGASDKKFLEAHATTFYGTATSSQFADLAERYEADAVYEPGTVVVFGGDKELTLSTNSYDTRVAGVISTAPGLRMNEKAGSDETHPFLALTGRVPCKMIGSGKKGDMIVTSSTPGYAQAADATKIVHGSIIGKALEDWDHVDGGTVVEISIRVS